MYELRVKVFSHLQRQSLDFYTEQKAGVVMTRMTSDIDALAALFQDGLVNLAVQLLTLVVITIVLVALNPLSGRHHPARRRAGDGGADLVVPRRLGADLPRRAGQDRASCCPISPRAWPGCGSSSPTTADDTT